MKKVALLIFLLTLNHSFYSQTLAKEITGTVNSYQNKPLKDVNITILGTFISTKTDEMGQYSINASINDQIQYSYNGFRTVTILVEDVTNILNIEMDNYVNQLDRTITDTLKVSSTSSKSRIISGVITYLNEPISDVNIIIEGTTKGTKTNKRGYYSISANIRDLLQFSHVAFKTVNIMIEDITKELNIEMITHANELDEVVIIAKTTEGKVLKMSKKAEQELSTSRGIIDPKRAGFAVGFIDGEEISNAYPNIQEALRGKISGYVYDIVTGQSFLRGVGMSINQEYPAAWEVDGVFTPNPPINLDLSQIVNVYILKSLAATNKYGSQANGGIIVINTKSGNLYKNNAIKNATNQFANKNLYNNDAIDISKVNFIQNPYSKILESFNDKQVAFNYYNETLTNEIKAYYNHIAIAQTFTIFYKDPELGQNILSEISKKYGNNPEILKALAYQMQANGKNINAVKIYENIFQLRPKYAQSYRDLANAYLETDQFKKSWRLFMVYLMQGYNINNPIGEIIYNEMEYLYYIRKDRAEIKEQFVPKSKNFNDFKLDMRIVFEWNTSEAEFELEFVGPDQRSYVFDHSLTYDEDLITDEKLKGYSSKEFIIDKMGEGDWLINLTYNGNKKNEPTYFKITQYFNWGSPNQRKIVKVYELTPDLNQKLQLLKLNNNLL